MAVVAVAACYLSAVGDGYGYGWSWLFAAVFGAPVLAWVLAAHSRIAPRVGLALLVLMGVTVAVSRGQPDNVEPPFLDWQVVYGWVGIPLCAVALWFDRRVAARDGEQPDGEQPDGEHRDGEHRDRDRAGVAGAVALLALAAPVAGGCVWAVTADRDKGGFTTLTSDASVDEVLPLPTGLTVVTTWSETGSAGYGDRLVVVAGPAGWSRGRVADALERHLAGTGWRSRGLDEILRMPRYTKPVGGFLNWHSHDVLVDRDQQFTAPGSAPPDAAILVIDPWTPFTGP